MSDLAGDDIEQQLKLLRDQVARLVTENLELSRQLEDLQRARTDASVEALANSTIRSLRRAESQINAQSPDDRRYVIQELQTSFKGMFLPREETLDFRTPIPEYGTPTGHLSTVQMTFAQVPVLPALPAAGHTIRPLLERLQADFLAWERSEGSREAAEIVAQAARLLSMPQPWTTPEYSRNMLGLAEILLSFSKTIQPVFTLTGIEPYQRAVGDLLQLAQTLVGLPSLEAGELQKLSAALERVLSSQGKLK